MFYYRIHQLGKNSFRGYIMEPADNKGNLKRNDNYNYVKGTTEEEVYNKLLQLYQKSLN